MTCHVVMNFDLKRSEVANFKALLTLHLPDARTFDGCGSAQVIENQDNGTNILILELWASRDQFEKYIAWRTETGVLAQLAACCASDPDMRICDPVVA
ncbi:MAG: quinol monooxygenase YgiN [Gammaproteobacteria bacterium]|jgi:quinol monooxygenase YgiN